MITLTKIAKMANVSLSTASKAFSMSPEVSEETRNLIFDIAKKNGVLKKFYNAKYPKLVIGVICSDYINSFYPNILSDIQEKLTEYGCDMSVASSKTSKMKELELYDYYTMYTDVDAILTIERSVELPCDFPLPRVDISPSKVDRSVPSVVINFEAIRDAIVYFHSKNVSSIAFLTNNIGSGRSWKYYKFMNEIYGEHSDQIIDLPEYRGGACGYEGAKKLILEKNVPRALFCEQDEIALGAIRAFYEFGYKIPEDIAVVGWNDRSFGEFSMPSLSTINISTKEVISESVDMLIKTLSGERCKQYIEIPSSFIPRESSKIK